MDCHLLQWQTVVHWVHLLIVACANYCSYMMWPLISFYSYRLWSRPVSVVTCCGLCRFLQLQAVVYVSSCSYRLWSVSYRMWGYGMCHLLQLQADLCQFLQLQGVGCASYCIDWLWSIQCIYWLWPCQLLQLIMWPLPVSAVKSCDVSLCSYMLWSVHVTTVTNCGLWHFL